MTSHAQIEALIRRITPPWNWARGAYSWYGFCAGLTYRTIAELGGAVPDGPYGSAWLAYLATTIESRDPAKAPPGAVHYWDYTGTAGNGQRERWGHVTLDVLGGGTDTLGATDHAHEFWARSAGLISVRAQTARGMKYLGWSRYYGRRNRLTITAINEAPAGGGEKPLPQPPIPVLREEEDDDMAPKIIHRNTGGDEWSLVHPDLRGASVLERGYIVTTDPDEAVAWGRTWGVGGGKDSYAADVDRAGYIDIQDAARRVYDAKQRGLESSGQAPTG